MTPTGNDIWKLMAFWGMCTWYIALPQQERKKILSLGKYKHHIWHRAIYLPSTQTTDFFSSKSTANHLIVTMVLMSLIWCHGIGSHSITFHQTAQCVIVLLSICEGSLWAVGISQHCWNNMRSEHCVLQSWFVEIKLKYDI